MRLYVWHGSSHWLGRLLCAWSASFGKLLPWQCLVHSMQSYTPSVRTSLPTPLLHDDSVRFHLPLSLGACALVLGACPFLRFGICRPCAVSPPLILGAFALATGRLPSFLWLGICRPCAVSPPLTLGALAHATGRLPSFVWLGTCRSFAVSPQLRLCDRPPAIEARRTRRCTQVCRRVRLLRTRRRLCRPATRW